MYLRAARKYLSAAASCNLAGSLYVCEQVYGYFMDNKRVHEYNEYCTQINDLEYLDAQTKVSWSCSGTIAGGVIKSRKLGGGGE